MTESPSGGPARRGRGRVARRIFVGALVVAAIATILAEFVVPEVWGIEGESAWILYIGGLGLLAGLAGLVTVIAGIMFVVRTFATREGRVDPFMRWVVVLAGLVVLGALALRLFHH